MRAVLTGANRGIGLELVRQLIARGDEVHAGARDPGAASELGRTGAHVHTLDVTDAASVSAFAQAIGDVPVDLVINNAGNDSGPSQSLRQMPWARCE